MKKLKTRIQVLLCVVTMLAQMISPMGTVTVKADTTGTNTNTEDISSEYVEPNSPAVTYNMNIDWKYKRAVDGYTGPLATAREGVAKDGKQFYEVGYDDSDWETVSVPHAINADDSFDDVGYDKGEGSLYRGFMFYRKNITVPESDAGKKFILEFEAFRQSIYLYVNGEMVGYYEAGITAIGFDITDYIKPGEENLIAVATDNTAARGATSYMGETIPGHEPGDWSGVHYQWNTTDFNEVQGGLTGNVYLYAKNKIYQTLPLYNNLKTTGNYIYADNFDLRGGSADISVEAEIRNESGTDQDITLEVNVVDGDGLLVASFEKTQNVAATDTDSDQFLTMVPETAYDANGNGVETGTVDISTVDVTTIKVTQNVEGLRFWSDESPYLYKVYTILKQGDTVIDHQEITTGFREVVYDKDKGLLINGKSTYLTGYAQRSTNEWASIGVANDWLSDMDMQLVKESNANMIRWMHIAPNPADIRAGDKYGVVSVCPAGDKEGDQSGRTWDQRLEVMRDTIIYYRNSPSIIFWEAGNNNISAEHMKQMTDLRKALDPTGDRFMGCRSLDSVAQIAEAEWVGTMINRHDASAYNAMVETGNYMPMIETEYHRNESPRRVWDDYTPPEYDYVNKWLGDGGSKTDGYDIWDQTQEDFAVTMASDYAYFYNNRVGGTGKNYYSGAALMVWSDSNMHVRNCGTENSRTSGRVDPIRVKKESFYAIQAVQADSPLIEIIGHWNYPEYIEGDKENGNYWYEDKTFVTDAAGISYWEGNGTLLQRDPTNKTVYVIGSPSVTKVELYVNDKLVGTDSKPDNNCIYAFSGIDVTQSGKVSAKAYNDRDEAVAEDVVVTSGEATTLRLTPVTGPEGFLADGSDIMYVDVEVVDADGNVCLIDERKITFEVSDATKAEFLGGFNSGVGDRIVNHKDYVFAECGINRVFIRSTREAGDFTLTASAEGITPVTIRLSAEEFAVNGGLTTVLPQAREQGEVPMVEQEEPAPSLKSLGDVFTASDNNTYAASEDTRDYYTVSVNGNAVSFTDRPYKPDANTGVVAEVGPILDALKEAGLDLNYTFATEGTLPDYFGREGGVLPWMNITAGERTIELANVATVVFIDGETNLTNFGVTPNSTNTTLKAELSAVIGALPNVSVEMDTTGKVCNFVYTPSNEVLLATVTNGDAGILEHDIVEIDTTCEAAANDLTLSADSSWDGSKYLKNETGGDVQMDGLSSDSMADLLWQADMRFDADGSGAIPANKSRNVGTCVTRHDKNGVSYFAVQTGGSKWTDYFEMDTTKWYRVQLVGRYSAPDANIDMTVYEYSGTEWVYKGTWESVNLRNLSAGNKSGANHWLVKNGTSVDNMKIIRLSADALQVAAEGGVTKVSAGKQLQMVATATRKGEAFTTPAITWSVYNADNTEKITDGSVTINANGLLVVEPTTAAQTITVRAEASAIDGTALLTTKQINITAVDLSNYKFDSLTLTADKKYVKAGEPLTIKAAASKNGVSVELAEDDLVWYLCDATNTRKLGDGLKWISLENGVLTVDERAISQDITVRAADTTDVVRGTFEVHVKSSDALENGEDGALDTLLFADNCETTNTKAEFVTSVDGSSAYQVTTGYDTAVINTTEDDVVVEMDIKFAKNQAGFYLGNSKGNVNTGIVLYGGNLQVYAGKYGVAENYITNTVTSNDWCHVTVIYNSGSYAHVVVDTYDENGNIDVAKRVVLKDIARRNDKSVSLVKFDSGVVYDNLRVLKPAATEVTISTDVTEVRAGEKVQVSSEMLWNGLLMKNPDVSTFEYKLYDAENQYPLESDEIRINGSGVISIDATVEPQDIYVRAIAKTTGVYASEKITIKETEGIFNVTEMGIDEAENRIVEIRVNKVYNYDDEVTFVTTVFDENGVVKAVKAKQLYGESLSLGENTVAIGMDIPVDYDKEKDTIKVFTVTRLDADAETTENTEGSSVEIRDNNAFITVPGYDAESDVVVLVLNRDTNEKKVQDSDIIYINQVSAEEVSNAIPVGDLEKCIAKTSGRVNEERVITVALLGEKSPVVEPDVSGGDEEPTPTPVPTATPKPTATPVPTAVPEPTATPVPTATPEPTTSPEPIATPTPTATPTPVTQEERDGVIYKVSGSGATINTIDKNATTLTIPDTITTSDGQVYKVTSVAKNAARGNTKLTQVVIGSNITSIGDYAFYGCKNLKTVTIGKNVTTIGKCAFAKNTSMTKITIPDKVKTVGANAFDGCTKLKTVKLGKSLTTISDKMFYKCTSLTKVSIPAKVTNIGKSAFANCTKLSNVTIGKKVSTIGANAFYKCTALKKVTIPASVKTIGGSAFSGCTKLATLTLGNKVATIDKNAFSKCTALKKVIIPASVKTIGANAFNGCKNLKSITIKTSKLTTKNVGNKAFSGIHAKATIKVPSKKLADYKTLLLKKGVKKTATFKK